MGATEIIALIVSLISGFVGITTLVTFCTNRKRAQQDAGAKDAILKTSLETIERQNENLLNGNKNIENKINEQNIRISRLEQTIDNSQLTTIPLKIAKLEATMQSTQKRFEDLRKSERR